MVTTMIVALSVAHFFNLVRNYGVMVASKNAGVTFIFLNLIAGMITTIMNMGIDTVSAAQCVAWIKSTGQCVVWE